MTHETNPPPKKPYQPPMLEVYGSIRELTKGAQPTGPMNDHTGGPIKT